MIIARNVLYYAAAATTAMAGIIHLMLGPGILGFNVYQGILFIVGGIAQVFWIIPMTSRWGRLWYGVGIAGTAVLMALFFITRIQGNPITGRGGGANTIPLLVEIFQAIFIGLATAIIVNDGRRKKIGVKTSAEYTTKKMDRRTVPILAGIVGVLVLSAVFVLPMTMQRPMRGPPAGQDGFGRPPSAVGQNSSQGQSANQLNTSKNQTCTITPSLIDVESTPQQTEGPYFVDGMPNRSDIRSDSSNGSIEEGIPLTLAIEVFNMNNGSCVPLSGAQVDIWHANSQGVYSRVTQQGTVGSNFLRSYQVTNDNGTVRFITVYPGWYEGRAIHIHIKVRTFEGSQKTLEWTSQMYFPDSVNEQVHTQAPYSKRGQVGTVNG